MTVMLRIATPLQAAAAITQILRRKGRLDRCHWSRARIHVASTRDDEEHRSRLSCLMLSSVGAHLANLPDIASDIFDATIAEMPARRPVSDLVNECAGACDAFSRLHVHPSWHPSATRRIPGPDEHDMAIMAEWTALCDEVASVSGKEASYGVPIGPMRRMPSEPSEAFRDELVRLRSFAGVRREIAEEQVRLLWDEAQKEHHG